MGAVVANKGSEELGSGAFDAATHTYSRKLLAPAAIYSTKTARLVKQHVPDAGFEKPLESEATSVPNGMVEQPAAAPDRRKVLRTSTMTRLASGGVHTERRRRAH